MPSMPATSSVLETSTPPWRPSLRSVVARPREPSSWARLTSSPCTRPARTPRTREASTTSWRSRSCASLRTRRASWSSNLSWRGCALLRSKFVRCSLTCIVQYSTVLYFTALYCKVQYSTMPYCTIQYSTKVTGQTVKSFYLHSSVLRLLNLTSVSTIQYNTVLYCTVQYCTVHRGNGTLHSCPVQSLGSPCRRN